MCISDCRLINIPKIQDLRGNLSFIESDRHVPFVIKRTYYLYDIASGASRAAHGHKTLKQFMIPVVGSFDVTLDDGISKTKYNLNRPNIGLYIPPMLWRELDNFTSGSVCLVLASDYYDEKEYIRDYQEFLNLCHNP